MALHIITDSTAEISQVDAHKLGITVIPLSVNFESDEYLDGVSISTKDFYVKLKTATILPKTSQATPERFVQAFQQCLARNPNDDILVITLSSALSGTYQSAMIAQSLVPTAKVTLFDSRQVSFALKSLVDVAIKRRDQGRTLHEIVEELTLLRDKVVLYAVIDDLTYLKMGGRISGPLASIGSMLKLKPIITIQEGLVKIAHKTLGSIKAQEWIIAQYQSDQCNAELPQCVAHSDALSTLQQFVSLCQRRIEKFPVLPVADIGITIGTHAGPGCVGLSYFRK